MRTEPPKTPREKMAAYRARMRAQGFRQIQLWVPDTRTPEFRAEARRQSLVIAAAAEREREEDAWWEKAVGKDGWE